MYLKFLFHILTAMKRLRASSQIEEDMEEMRVEGKKKKVFFSNGHFNKIFFLLFGPAQQSEAHMGVMELLKSRALLMPLGIGIVMQLSQQLSGTSAVISPMATRDSICFFLRNQRRLVLFHRAFHRRWIS